VGQEDVSHCILDNRTYQAWWYMPVIPPLGRLRYKDCEFKASLDYRMSTSDSPELLYGCLILFEWSLKKSNS
jgi:hypothetical protein